MAAVLDYLVIAVKWFALCYRTIVCPVLSVTLVYCGQVVGWIKMKLGTEVGPWPHCVRSGPSSPTTKKAHGTAPNCRPMSVVAKLLDGSRCHLVQT